MIGMSVNTNGIAIHAHESLTIDEIVSIIMAYEDLKPKVCRSAIHYIYSLREHLHRPGILVRTRGMDKEAIYERLHRPIKCECGCTVHRNTIAKHRKTMKHKNMLGETFRIKTI